VAKRKKTKVEPNTPEPAGPFNSAFGGLAALRAQMGDAPEQAPAPTPTERKKPAPASKYGKRVVLQKERKGHGGKTVTLVRTLTLKPEEMQALTKELKRSLGCGARIEDGEIVLQGDIADRAAKWFTKQGVAKVVVSG